MSKIEDAVAAKLQKRAEVGLAKYGVTMERTDLSRLDWLIHAQEEAMDLAVYLERLVQDLKTEPVRLTDNDIKLGQWVEVIETIGQIRKGETGRVISIDWDPWESRNAKYRVWVSPFRDFVTVAHRLKDATPKV
jgi:hypothetical protein